jgi:hypothetical protein
MANHNRPPANYIGTVLFLAYIFLALILIAHLTLKLIRVYRVHPITPGTFIYLALLTFSVMSVNMISVLVDSYTRWAHGSEVHSGFPTLDHMWRWMLESTLFSDFASDLLSSSSSLLWADAALVWTLGVNMWMAVKGRRRRLDGRTMGELFMVAQILPVSVAMQLFMLVTLLRTKETDSEVRAKNNNDSSSTRALSRLLLFVAVLYIACLVAISSLIPSTRVSLSGVVILIFRTCLIAPYVISYSFPAHDCDAEAIILSTNHALLAGIAILAAQQLSTGFQGEGGSGLVGGWKASAPVRTLIIDAILGLVGVVMWNREACCSGRARVNTVSARDSVLIAFSLIIRV